MLTSVAYLLLTVTLDLYPRASFTKLSVVTDKVTKDNPLMHPMTNSSSVETAR